MAVRWESNDHPKTQYIRDSNQREFDEWLDEHNNKLKAEGYAIAMELTDSGQPLAPNPFLKVTE